MCTDGHRSNLGKVNDVWWGGVKVSERNREGSGSFGQCFGVLLRIKKIQREIKKKSSVVCFHQKMKELYPSVT